MTMKARKGQTVTTQIISSFTMSGSPRISTRWPHGRLDDGYAIIGLRKEQPMFDFGRLDRMQPPPPLPPWKIGGPGANGRCRRLVSSSDWILRCQSHKSPEFDSRPCSNNNSASQGRRQPANPRQRLEQRLRQMYGDQLFRPGSYMAPDQLGPALEPLKVAESPVQSIRGRVLGPLKSLARKVFDESEDVITEGSSNCRQLAPEVASALPAVFEWCDNAHNRNNSGSRSGADLVQPLSHRTARKIAVRRDLGNWVFLYFRARRVCWEFMVYEERANYSLVDLYAEGVLDRWTVKLRFRMKREAPMKFPLLAFLSRMGLDSDADLVFTTDGFFGDMIVGGLKKRNDVPHRVVSYNTTADALGLQNGDSVFVVRASPNLRANVESHLDMVRRRSARHVGLPEADEFLDSDLGSDDGSSDNGSESDYDEADEASEVTTLIEDLEDGMRPEFPSS